MPDTPFVSVIIPVFHDWDSLTVCLQALSDQTYPQQKFEVIVVNNDPDDNPQLCPKLPNLRLLDENTPGSYAARNTGIRAAYGQVLGFCDADCIPELDWIEQGIQDLQSSPEVSRLA